VSGRACRSSCAALGIDTVETTFDGYKINTKIDPKKFEVRK
jgi:hypothetical protein